MLAAKHPDQTARLKALRRYGILDTPREAEFDEIVDLVARICEAPISVINFIDQDRQWFKAECGLDADQTPLDTSICSHVILQDQFVEIPDTLDDPRMQDNPLCAGDPGLRFYAGALLKSEEGLPLGTLCVLDYKPRRLDALQRQAVQVLSRQIMAQLNLRLALRRQEILRREIDHRVKNSLQITTALLRIRQGSVTDQTAREVLEDAGQRIDTIALLHKQLHDSDDSGDVDIGRYMSEVRALLQAQAPDSIRIETGFGTLHMPSGQAATLAIIANEFVSNSIKHAFPDGRPGRIVLSGRLDGANGLVIDMRDDGAGPAAQPANPGGLGTLLIDACAEQFGGRVDRLSVDQGHAIRITFPVESGRAGG